MSAITASGDTTPEVITPKVIGPTEAAMYGYNMLLSQPYNFSDDTLVGNMQLLGVMPHEYDAGSPGDVMLNPRMNTQMCFRVYYQAEVGKNYEVIWEARNSADDAYVVIDTQYYTIASTPAPIFLVTSVPSETYMLRVSVYAEVAGGGSYESVTEAALVTGFNFDPEDKTSIAV